MEVFKKKPIYLSIYSTLRQEIEAGLYDKTDKFPSEKVLCQRFDVERNTVRKSLQLLVEDGCIRRIPGYGTVLLQQEPDSGDSSSNGSRVILMLIRRERMIRNGYENFHLNLCEQLTQVLGRTGCSLIMKIVFPQDDILQVVRTVRPAAVIFDSYFSEADYEALLQEHYLCLAVNNYTPVMTSIVNNNEESAVQVMEALHRNGHRRIAVIAGPGKFQTSADRLRGVMRFCKEQQLPSDCLQVCTGDWSFDSGYQLTQKIFSVPVQDRPTAVFAFNDDMAYGCMHALQELNQSVPEEVSVVGFDHNSRFRAIGGQLTTVDCNIDALAQYTAMCLSHMLCHGANLFPGIIQVNTRLVDNGTLARAK